MRTALFLALALFAPQFTTPLHVPVAGGGVSCTGSDNFSGTGALSSCWTTTWTNFTFGNTIATASRSSGTLIGGSAFTVAPAAYTGGTFGSSYYAEITVTALTSPANYYLCVMTTSAGNGYCYNQAGGSIQKWTTGSPSAIIFACGGATVGHTYKLDDNAGVLGFYDLTAGGGAICTGSDTTYTSGVPLLIVDYGGGGSGTQLSNFVTGTP